MSDAQTLIRDAQDKAERLCALAVEQTPAAYQSFITLIEQRRKVGGTRQAPIFATIRQPYLSVDGRVKWARDEHVRDDTRFDVQTEFVVEATSGQLLARATLTSEIYGTAVAHARVFLGGDGVNEPTPSRRARRRPWVARSACGASDATAPESPRPRKSCVWPSGPTERVPEPDAARTQAPRRRRGRPRGLGGAAIRA